MNDLTQEEVNEALEAGSGASRDYGLTIGSRHHPSDDEQRAFRKRMRVFLEALPDYVSVRDILQLMDDAPPMITDKTIEIAARAIVRARGAAVVASDEHWPAHVAQHYAMRNKYPDHEKGSSLITDAFRDARAALESAAPESDNGWLPIDSVPKDGTPLLMVYPPDGKTVLKPRYGVGCIGDPTGDGIGLLFDWPWTLRPTHWRPLPAPPPPRFRRRINPRHEKSRSLWHSRQNAD